MSKAWCLAWEGQFHGVFIRQASVFDFGAFQAEFFRMLPWFSAAFIDFHFLFNTLNQNRLFMSRDDFCRRVHWRPGARALGRAERK